MNVTIKKIAKDHYIATATRGKRVVTGEGKGPLSAAHDLGRKLFALPEQAEDACGESSTTASADS